MGDELDIQTMSRQELDAKRQELLLEVQVRRDAIKRIVARLEATRPHRIGPKGIPSAEKFGDIGGRR
jgi:hypothetical protein